MVENIYKFVICQFKIIYLVALIITFATIQIGNSETQVQSVTIDDIKAPNSLNVAKLRMLSVGHCSSLQQTAVYQQEHGISDFNLIQQIGEGGYGSTYAVQNKHDQKVYAIKKVLKERFDKVELNVLKTMSICHTTRYIDHFEDEMFQYIVMEFANGGDLHQHLIRNKQLNKYFTEQTLFCVLAQMLLALHSMHSACILHRDMKPRNIFVNLTDDYLLKVYCLIGDFGLSVQQSSEDEIQNKICGTRGYFPPEMIITQQYNHKCDVWGCGLIMYELCQLRTQFPDKNGPDQSKEIEQCYFEPIPQFYSQELSNIIFSMLKKNPEERASVEDIIQNKEYKWLQKILAEVREADRQYEAKIFNIK